MKYRRIVCVFVIFVVLSMVLSATAFATMESSQYLGYYNAYITKIGNTVNVHFDVQGTGIMDKIGATEIYLYERPDSYSSWTPVHTYLSTNPDYYASMIEINTGYKDDYVSHSGNSSYQYMAYVTIYAEKNGGSDSRNLVIYS